MAQIVDVRGSGGDFASQVAEDVVSTKVCHKCAADQPLTAFAERAKKLNLPNDLTIEYLVANFGHLLNCPVFNVPFNWSSNKLIDTSPTLDKIIPESGYVMGNVQVISHQANSMKRNANFAQLSLFAQWINQLVDQYSIKEKIV